MLGKFLFFIYVAPTCRAEPESVTNWIKICGRLTLHYYIHKNSQTV